MNVHGFEKLSWLRRQRAPTVLVLFVLTGLWFAYQSFSSEAGKGLALWIFSPSGSPNETTLSTERGARLGHAQRALKAPSGNVDRAAEDASQTASRPQVGVQQVTTGKQSPTIANVEGDVALSFDTRSDGADTR